MALSSSRLSEVWTRTSFVTIIFVAVLTVSGCGKVGRDGSNYGLLKIQAPNGEEFFFRRQVRGWNYDALSLSKNPNHCAEPDPANALIFIGMGPIEVFYKFEGNQLHLYKMQEVNSPKDFSTDVKFVFHELTNQQYIELRETYASKGLNISNVYINSELSCSN